MKQQKSSPKKLKGSCYCGAVRFTIKGPAKFSANCHCSLCRRFHGAPFVTWCGFQEQQVAIKSKKGALKTFRTLKTGTRKFCGHCGSMIFFIGRRWPGEVHIARALIHQEQGLSPSVHAFYSHRAQWINVEKRLKKFGGKNGVTPL